MANHHGHRSGDERENDDDDESENDSGCGDIGILFESHRPTIIKRFEWGSPSCSRSNLAAESVTDVVTSKDVAITITTDFAAFDTIESDTRAPIEASAVPRRTHTTKEWQETEKEPTRSLATILPPVTPTSPFVVYRALVRCIDDDPGAVVSGHYVWPASLLLCDYLVANHHCSRQSSAGGGGSNAAHGHDNDNANDNRNSRTNNKNDDDTNDDDNDAQNVVRSVLELGAGVGLPSIVASQVFGNTLATLVVTDRDPTAVERARENHQRSMKDAARRQGGKPESARIRRRENENELENENTAACGGVPPIRTGESTINTNATAFAFAAAPPPIRTEFLVLRWGSESDWQRLGECMNTNGPREPQTLMQTRDQEAPPNKQGFFDLVVGSDLIDCVETVEPLFHTIDRALKSGNSSISSDSEHTVNNVHVNNTHGRSRCLLSQSFAYDSETEDEIDAACDRFHLERRILADTRLVPTPPKRNGHSTGESNGATSTMTIQEFQRKPKY